MTTKALVEAKIRSLEHEGVLIELDAAMLHDCVPCELEVCLWIQVSTHRFSGNDSSMSCQYADGSSAKDKWAFALEELSSLREAD